MEHTIVDMPQKVTYFSFREKKTRKTYKWIENLYIFIKLCILIHTDNTLIYTVVSKEAIIVFKLNLYINT